MIVAELALGVVQEPDGKKLLMNLVVTAFWLLYLYHQWLEQDESLDNVVSVFDDIS